MSYATPSASSRALNALQNKSCQRLAGPQAHGSHTYVNCSGDKSTVRHTEVLEVMAFDCASMLKPGWAFTNCCTAFKLRSQRRCNSSTPPTRSTQVRASI